MEKAFKDLIYLKKKFRIAFIKAKGLNWRNYFERDIDNGDELVKLRGQEIKKLIASMNESFDMQYFHQISYDFFT